MEMMEKYSRKCDICGGRIEQGQRIEWSEETCKAVHWNCRSYAHTPPVPGKDIDDFQRDMTWTELVGLMRDHEQYASNSKLSCLSVEDSLRVSDWAGVTFDDAVGMLERGWPDGVKKVEEFAKKIGHLAGARTMGPALHYDVTGAMVDVGVYVTGQPECMMEPVCEERQGSGRIIRMVIGAFYSSGNSPKEIEHRGAAALALIEALETAGYCVEVIHAMACNPGVRKESPHYELDVMLKNAGEPLDMDRLAFALIHRSMFRRIYFAAEERESYVVRKRFGLHDESGGTYGGPSETRLEADIKLETLSAYNSQKFSTLESTAAWMRGILEKYNLIEND